MDTKDLEAKFTTQLSMHQNEGNNSYFGEIGTETLNQEHGFNFIENDSDKCSEMQAKIKEAEKLVHIMNEDRSQIKENLEGRKSDRERTLSLLRYKLSPEDAGIIKCLSWKRYELKYLRQDLDKKLAKNQTKEVENELHPSIKNHDDLIRSLQHRLLHGSKSIAKEKQLLREIKRLEGTTVDTDMVAGNAAVQMKGWTSASIEEIQDQIQLIVVKIGEMKKRDQEVRAKIEQVEKEKAAAEKDISVLQKELAKVHQKKNEADTLVFELRKQKDEAVVSVIFGAKEDNSANSWCRSFSPKTKNNSDIFEVFLKMYLSVLINARVLDAKKDVASLKEFSP